MDTAPAQHSNTYQSLVEAVADIVFTTNGAGEMEGPQPSWQAFTGQDDPEYRAGGGFAMVHPEDREELSTVWQRAVSTECALEAEYRLWHAPTQSWRNVAVRAICVAGTGFPASKWIGMAQDITGRKLAEDALRESEARYRFLAEAIPQMLWTATPAGQLDYVSKQVVDYFGTAKEALLGAGWLTGVHSEDRGNAIETWQQALATGQPYETAFRLRRGLDETWRWHLVRALPMKNASGDVLQWFGTCTDFHDQKETEAGLVRANRELEEFAYVVSHDLREPLRMVNIYTELLLQRVRKNFLPDLQVEEAERFAGFITSGVLRMDNLITDLLAFSRVIHEEKPAQDDSRPQVADLKVSWEYALAALKTSIDETKAEIHSELLPTVRGEEHHFALVFQNLIGNAIKYRKPGVPPQIYVSAEAHEDNWMITVSDQGIGFSPQYSERIFGLFRRLHTSEYPGTGLGLTICRRLVQRYGGSIHAESGGENCGSKFQILLRGLAKTSA